MMGRETTHDRMPHFLSDQYEMGREYSGFVNAGRYDEVLVRGDVDGRNSWRSGCVPGGWWPR